MLLSFLVCLSLLWFPKVTSGDTYSDLQKTIDELNQKIKDTQNRAATLANQISYMDNQSRLTTLKIQETTEKVAQTEAEIEILTSRIVILEKSLTNISGLLIDRVVATYKNLHVPAGLTIFSSDGFSELISRTKYLSLVQAHDKKILFDVQSTKADFEQQKKLMEEKKQELDLLTKKLEDQKASLAQQKQEKESLLIITKNDEKRYQELLAKTKAEQAAIQSAVRQALLSLKDGTPVEEGKEIALVGNTGAPSCSTGAHLHFEVTKDGARQNPTDYLKSRDVIWDNAPDGPFPFNGSWNWPLNSPIRVTQGYGMTYFARTGFYGGGGHTGVDMNSTDIVIHAPKNGTLYKGSTRCGSSAIKWVAIDHGGGIMSWYFHVQ